MQNDSFQQLWAAQDARLNETLRLNQQLWLRSEMQRPRALVRRLRYGTGVNIAFGVACLLANGIFLGTHFGEPRFALPAVALQLWLIGALAATIAQLVQAAAVDFGAPVVTIQRRLEALRARDVRSLRVLFLSGLPVWCVPFLIVAFEAWFEVDLYALVGATNLVIGLAASIALALATMWACRRITPRIDGSPVLRRFVRSLGGHSLSAAQDELARIAAFEREES